jgi:hypothetical protein
VWTSRCVRRAVVMSLRFTLSVHLQSPGGLLPEVCGGPGDRPCLLHPTDNPFTKIRGHLCNKHCGILRLKKKRNNVCLGWTLWLKPIILNYLGGRYPEAQGLYLALAKSAQDPISANTRLHVPVIPATQDT